MDNENLMKRLQAGTRNYDDANSLHAECYGTIGALEQENERLKITAMNLVNAVENNDDLPPIKYALKCGRLVNEVRALCGKTVALHKEGEL